jgi:hypothetical protein
MASNIGNDVEVVVRTWGGEDAFVANIVTIWEFNYAGAEQLFEVLKTGTYRIELWGARGGAFGSPSFTLGWGGYTAGEVSLTLGEEMYIYVGQLGRPSPALNGTGAPTSFNGGGAGGSSYSSSYSAGSGGGGATDVRLVNGAWGDVTGLRSRIMVAGAGGGVSNWLGTDGPLTPRVDPNGVNYRGFAGGLIAESTWSCNFAYEAPGGSQISGFSFGTGQTGRNATGLSHNAEGNGGGGGGYYGGYSVTSTAIHSNTNGAGGSSFISGHTGSVAVVSASSTSPRTGTSGAACASGTSDNLCSVHYSGKVFANTVMIDGAGYGWTNVRGSLTSMPNPVGGTYASGTGHTGNGFARITYLGS